MTASEVPVGHAWAGWLFRVLITAQALLACAQPVLAGGFLAGHYDLLAVHLLVGRSIAGVGIALVPGAVLWWRFGGGPALSIAVCTVLLGAEALQILLGFSRTLAVHIPLGVLIVLSILWLFTWAWRR